MLLIGIVYLACAAMMLIIYDCIPHDDAAQHEPAPVRIAARR